MHERTKPTPEGLSKGIRRIIEESKGKFSFTAASILMGILSPLSELGDLGLTEEETDIILKYARAAATEAQRRIEEEMTQNPLLQMDVLFAGESVRIAKDSEITSEVKENELLRLGLARQALRETQRNIKSQVDAVWPPLERRNQKDLLDATYDVISSQTRKLLWVSDYLYTELVCGSRQSCSIIMKALGLGELEFSNDESRMHNLPTAINGVTGNVSDLTFDRGEINLHFGVAFDFDAVFRIAQSYDLPPLE